MQNGSRASLNAETNNIDCAFCQRSDIAANILKETTAFLVVADHAPLVEGHILIIPKSHYACYGEVPAELDAELLALKREVQEFFAQYYAPAVFWEHGVFRQTVFHAHLHCFPLVTQSMSWRRDYIASSCIRKMIYVRGMSPGARTFTWRMPAMPSSSLQRWTAMCTSSKMCYGMAYPHAAIRRNGGRSSNDMKRVAR